MEGTGVHEFTLTDARGAEHSYLVQEHPAGDGCAIFYELMGLGMPTLLGLLGAALKSEELIRDVLAAMSAKSDEDAPPFDWQDLARKLGELELEKVGQEIGRALATGKAPALTRALLSKTHRDGKLLNGAAFDLAYQANYWEMVRAIFKVCQVNRFLGDFSTLPSSPLEKRPASATPLPVS